MTGRHRGHEPGGHGYAGGAEQALREILVHREGGSQLAAARVGHADHVEDRLQRAPLAGATVQREEQHVGPPNDGKFGEALGEHFALLLLELRHRGRRRAHCAAQHVCLLGIIEEPGARVHDVDVVFAAAQRGDDLGGAGERDGAFCGGAACKNGDAHQRMPASW